jgi:2-succinyl-5-enolpyruvyl-6-hydroxy-3-cyclohexene-1-carboxylate synthase
MTILIEELIAQNVRDFFLAPGSRSTPLAIALSRHPEVGIHRHFDERGLGFCAAGFGLGKERPGAIVVTSGTAVGNLMPAIMEACHASIPLIILTADRPQELREVSANQTTDQLKIFQNFVRWQCEIDPSMPLASIRSKAAQAVFRSQHPHPGPVHINCPFREPLYNDQLSLNDRHTPVAIQAQQSFACPPRHLPSRGIILIGRLPKRSDLQAALASASKLQWPIFADLLSGARLFESEQLIHHYDWSFWKSPPPTDCIVHFGERLTSKRLMEWLSAHPPKNYIHVSPHTHWVDPSSLLTERIFAEVPAAAASFTNTPDPTWLPNWTSRDRLPSIDGTFTETSAMRTLSQLPLDDWAIFVANSMPIREADWFLFPKKCQGFFANRGLSGIDGNIGTIAGLSIGLNAPVLAILGDMTTLHDLNSMVLLNNSRKPVILLVSNNNGCGIFSHLSVAPDAHFETLFGFPHELSFEHAARMFQLPYTYVDTNETLEAAMRRAIRDQQSCLIEIKTSRAQNLAHHQKIKKNVTCCTN